MTHKLRSEMSSQKIYLSADIRFGSLTLLGGFVILDLKRLKSSTKIALAHDLTLLNTHRIICYLLKKSFDEDLPD